MSIYKNYYFGIRKKYDISTKPIMIGKTSIRMESPVMATSNDFQGIPSFSIIKDDNPTLWDRKNALQSQIICGSPMANHVELKSKKTMGGHLLFNGR
jgi:hypothetical protein